MNETIEVGTSGSVQVLFTSAADVQRLGGSVTLGFGNFVKLSGDFGFEKTEAGTILIGAS